MKKDNDLKTVKTLAILVTGFFAVGFFDGVFTLDVPNWLYFFVGIGMIFCQIWLLKILFRLNK